MVVVFSLHFWQTDIIYFLWVVIFFESSAESSAPRWASAWELSMVCLACRVGSNYQSLQMLGTGKTTTSGRWRLTGSNQNGGFHPTQMVVQPCIWWDIKLIIWIHVWENSFSFALGSRVVTFYFFLKMSILALGFNMNSGIRICGIFLPDLSECDLTVNGVVK